MKFFHIYDVGFIRYGIYVEGSIDAHDINSVFFNRQIFSVDAITILLWSTGKSETTKIGFFGNFY